MKVVVVEDAGNDDLGELGQGQTGIKSVVVATPLPAGGVLDHTAGIGPVSYTHLESTSRDLLGD